MKIGNGKMVLEIYNENHTASYSLTVSVESFKKINESMTSGEGYLTVPLP